MSTICADDLLLDEIRRDRVVARPAPVRTRAGRSGGDHRARVAPARYEDFERRSGTLGDLLGGRVYPRLF